jgi:hypothetical protein
MSKQPMQNFKILEHLLGEKKHGERGKWTLRSACNAKGQDMHFAWTKSEREINTSYWIS